MSITYGLYIGVTCYYGPKHWLSLLDKKNKLQVKAKDTNDLQVQKNRCSLITGILNLHVINQGCCYLQNIVFMFEDFLYFWKSLKYNNIMEIWGKNPTTNIHLNISYRDKTSCSTCTIKVLEKGLLGFVLHLGSIFLKKTNAAILYIKCSLLKCYSCKCENSVF